MAHRFYAVVINILNKVKKKKKNPPANAGGVRDTGSIPGSGKSPGGWQATPVFLPGESHGQRSLAGYSP